MTLSHDDTKEIIDIVLASRREEARQLLHIELGRRGWQEPEFYAGVIKHGQGMPYSADQWFEFLSRNPNGHLRAESGLLDKLSERQRLELPPPTVA